MGRNTASVQENDEKYMRRCLQLARNGNGAVAPNPMVGAVVVHEGRIIGEGYHRRWGTPHAEVNAIASVRRPECLSASTLYCSLEPCAHYGKTPPCADLIVAKGIPRVVIGCLDPFAKVNGQGVKKLQEAGCEVTVGVLEEECLALNRRFMTFHTEHRPFITLKWAQSRDGYMGAEGCRVLFSTPQTQTLVHRLRAHSDAILVGGRTARVDNPSLTVREWSLPRQAPLRIVWDTHHDLPDTLALWNDEAETLRWTGHDLSELMALLYARGIQSLLVEGGAATLQAFLTADLWDEIRVETKSLCMGEGISAPTLPPASLASSVRYGDNEIRVYVRR